MLGAVARWFREAVEAGGFWPVAGTIAGVAILLLVIFLVVGSRDGAKSRSKTRDHMRKGIGSYRYVVDLVSIAALIDDRDRKHATGVPLEEGNIAEVLGRCAYGGVVRVFGETYADINPQYMAVFTFLKDAQGRSLDFARTHPSFADARKYCDGTYKNLIILTAYCALQLHREEGSTHIHDDGLAALAADLYGSQDAADAVLDSLFARSDELVNRTEETGEPDSGPAPQPAV